MSSSTVIAPLLPIIRFGSLRFLPPISPCLRSFWAAQVHLDIVTSSLELDANRRKGTYLIHISAAAFLPSNTYPIPYRTLQLPFPFPFHSKSTSSTSSSSSALVGSWFFSSSSLSHIFHPRFSLGAQPLNFLSPRLSRPSSLLRRQAGSPCYCPRGNTHPFSLLISSPLLFSNIDPRTW